MDKENATPQVRLDKWLWAARFFKTRSLAAEAIDGGKVHVNGERAKRSRIVRIGDRLEITRGREQFVVTVKDLSERRGPGSVAALLYEETEQSKQERKIASEQQRLNAMSSPGPDRRPTKQQRRKIIRFTGKG